MEIGARRERSSVRRRKRRRRDTTTELDAVGTRKAEKVKCDFRGHSAAESDLFPVRCGAGEIFRSSFADDMMHVVPKPAIGKRPSL